MTKFFFEDFKVGDRWDFGTWSATREEMIAFARQYDPQPIHIDEAAAAETHFGGLIASGWQTTIKTIGLFVEQLLAKSAGLASPGLDEIRWLKPVRAGDVIACSAEVFEVAESKSKPDRGRVHFAFLGVDQDGTPVMSARGLFFIARRRHGGAAQ